MRLLAGDHSLQFPRRPLVMGIINLSIDSFSGDGLQNVETALERARQFAGDGVEVIDVGAESARTNRPAISEADEANRLTDFVKRWRLEFSNRKSPLLSINTWRPAVARAVLRVGCDILNDLSALPTDANARICAETGAALLIMHSVGVPKVAHTHVGYDYVMARMEEFFAEKIALAVAAGVAREAIILDPGIDFAKQRDDNLRIYRELDRLRKFERPILLPVSRKTVIGDVLGIANAAERDAGTVACLVQGILRGANILRVHNVRAAVQAVRIVEAVEAA